MATSNTHQNQEKHKNRKMVHVYVSLSPFISTRLVYVPSINMMIKIKRHNFKAIKQIRNEILVSDFLPTYSERIKTGIIHSSKFLTSYMSGFITPATVFGVFFTFHLIYFRADHRDIAIELMPFSSLSLLSVV